MNKRNLFDPGEFSYNQEDDIIFVVLGDIIGKNGKDGWNKYIFGLFVLAEILHPENVYLLRGCIEEKISTSKEIENQNVADLIKCCNKMPYGIFGSHTKRSEGNILFTHQGIVDNLASMEELDSKTKKCLINAKHTLDYLKTEYIQDHEHISLWVSSHEYRNVIKNYYFTM